MVVMVVMVVIVVGLVRGLRGAAGDWRLAYWLLAAGLLATGYWQEWSTMFSVFFFLAASYWFLARVVFDD